MVKTPEEMQTVIENGELDYTPEPKILVVDSSSPLWPLAQEIEAGVFIEAGYVAHAKELEDEYAPYDSFFFTMMEDDEIKGVLRIIKHSDAGFKTIEDAQLGKLEIEDEWMQRLSPEAQKQIFEVGTIGVPKAYRTKDSGRASMWLYGAVLGYSRRENLPSAIASFDADYFEGFKGLFGGGLQQMGPAIEYMGSATVPVYMTESTAYASICSVDPTGELKETLDLGAQQITNA